MPILYFAITGLAGWVIGSTVNNATEPSPVYNTTPQEAQYFSGYEKIAIYAVLGVIAVHAAKKYI